MTKKAHKPNPFRVGCSGYYYPQWKNKFYPQGLAPKNWLTHYSSVFNAVELNGTFYRIPKLSDLKKYNANTPDAFRFSVKVNRLITHTLKLKASRQHISDFNNLISDGLGDKLAALLFQFPPSFRYTEENLGRILEFVPPGHMHVLEFRDASWWNKEAFAAFDKHKLSFCNLSHPVLPEAFHTNPDLFYFRFHGVPDLFKSSYSAGILAEFHNSLPARCKSYLIFFNNTYYDAAYLNALDLIHIHNTARNGPEDPAQKYPLTIS